MSAADDLIFVRQSVKAAAGLPNRGQVLAALDRIERALRRELDDTARIGGPRR